MTGDGVGSCVLKLNGNDGKLHDVVLHNCVYSPHFSNNLIIKSLSLIESRNNYVGFWQRV